MFVCLQKYKAIKTARCAWLKKTCFILFIFNFFVLNSAYSATNAVQDPFPFEKQVEILIQKTLPNASVGMILKDAQSGKVLYERRATEPFPPASNTKLLTAAASLLSLGPDFRFETAIWIDPKNVEGSVLKGDLYIQFTGDPSLEVQDIKKLITDISSLGIKQIQGDIIVDNTRFQKPVYALGWPWDALPWYYAAPVTAIVINENQIPLTITGNPVLGGKAKVSLNESDIDKIQLQSNLVSVSETEAETECQIQVNMNEQNELSVGGCWPIQANPITLSVALKNPALYAKRIILESLRAANIQFSGTFVVGSVPIQNKESKDKILKKIAAKQSSVLSDLLKTMLKDSNNLTAEILTKTLGFKHYNQGTFQAGTRAIKTVLSEPLGVQFQNSRLFDGSGLSFYNAFSPLEFARLLSAMHHDKAFGTYFKEAITVLGEQGFREDFSKDLKGRVRAKTGHLKGISTLCGYLTPLKGGERIFAIMIDHVVEAPAAIQHLEEELCRLMIAWE